MKIKNESVTIKIGREQKTFQNLILNDYIDLYADSFLSFKDKFLAYCFIKLDTLQEITPESTQMEYDLVLENYLRDFEEIYTENTIINKYNYKNVVENKVGNLNGHKITGIGFGLWDIETDNYKLYAFLDVSSYNVVIQNNQSVSVSRIDKVTSDLKFYCDDNSIKYPLHLTTKGKIEFKANDYDTVFPKLYSIGLGTLYNQMEKEILIKDLDFKKESLGVLRITGAKDYASYPSYNTFPNPNLYPGRINTDLEPLRIEGKENINKANLDFSLEGAFIDKDLSEGLYPSIFLYPNNELYPEKAITKWVIYKFQLYRQRYEGEEEIIEPLNQYYKQSQFTELTGNLKLKIKYEKG